MISELVYTLKEVSKFINNAYEINQGGCCYLAYCIAKNLERLHIKYKVIIYEKLGFIDSRIEQFIKDRNYNIIHNHYAIIIGSDVINGWDHSDYTVCNLSSVDLKWMWLKGVDNGGWNDIFNIGKCKVIREIINSIFKDYAKEN